MKPTVLLLLLSALLPAAAKTIYVSADSPAEYYNYDESEDRWYYYDSNWDPVYIDGEPGDSWENAYSSISYACNAAESGDAVLVGPGTYDPFHPNDDRGITIRSVAGAERTIVDADGRSRCVELGATDRIVGFTLLNSELAGLWGGYADSCIIRNCGSVKNERSEYSGDVVQQYQGEGGVFDAILTDCVIENCLGGGADNCTLDRCIVRNCRGNDYGGIGSCIAKNCLIVGNRAEVMDSADFWEGYCGGASDSELYNCTVVENYAQRKFGGAGGVEPYDSHSWYSIGPCKVYNSIVVNNTCGNGTTSNYGQYNWGNGIDGSVFAYSCAYPKPAGTGNTGTAPRFANTTTYALASGSAGINAGNNAYARGSHDLNGLPRVHGGRVDMGASEYVAASQICTVHFDAGAGSVDADSMLAVVGSALGVLPVPYREGWRFEGWFDGRDLVTAQTAASGRNMYLDARWSEETDSVWQPVYRFYSKSYKGHFYTIDPEERATLMCTNPNWKYEGVAYYAATEEAQGTVPLYRFYSRNYRGHFYTIDENEMRTVRDTNRNWSYEGIAFHVYPSRRADPLRSAAAIYRFWSNGYRHHFFTIDENEMRDIRRTNRNWSYEGTAFYAYEDDPGGGGSPPGTPTGIEAVALDGRRVSVSWNSVSGATGYRATVHWTYYSGDGDEVDRSEDYELDETNLDLTFVAGDSGVWVEVSAVNDYGESEAGYSNQVDPTAGAGPSGLQATLSGSALRLTWSHAADARYYAVYVGGPRESNAAGNPQPGSEYGTTTGTEFVIDPVPWYENDAWFYEWGPVFYVYAYRDAGWSEPAVCYFSVE